MSGIMRLAERGANGYPKQYSSLAEAGFLQSWTAQNDILEPITPYLSAYWKGNDLNDSIDNHLLTNNNAVTFTNGKHGDAFTLNGSDQSLALNSFTSINVDGLSCWVNLNDTITEDSSPSQCLFQYDGTPNVLSFGNSTGYVDSALTLQDGSTKRTGIEGYTFNANTYYHIVLIWSSANAQYSIYINSVLQTNVINDGGCGRMTCGSDVLFGGRTDEEDRYLGGQIDEIAIWSGYELSASEVSALYNSGTGAFLR